MINDDELRGSYDRLLASRAEMADNRQDCPPLDRLVELVLRQGEEESRLAVLDHVMACPACGPEFALLRSADRAAGPVCP